MALIAELKKGKVEIDVNQQKIIIANSITIPYQRIEPTEWGYVYEKYVGQHFEELGYEVDYRGLRNPFFDQGIDLIVKKENSTKYIQCKFTGTKKRFGKQEIEKILYKAGNFMYRNLDDGPKPTFLLSVNSIPDTFTRNSGKVKILPEYKISGYPLMDYFLSKNKSQNFVKLAVEEIPMTF